MHLKLSKGHNFKLSNHPVKEISDLENSKKIVIHPLEFPYVKPKLLVKDSEAVNVGTPLFIDKLNPDVKFVSSVSGEVQEIVYGDRRSIQSIIINNEDQLSDEIIILNDQISLNNDSKIKAVASKPSLIDVNNLDKVISIKALYPTWIQLRDEEDRIIYSRLMNKNEEYTYSISDNYFLTVGNAGNIIVSIGGELKGRLGKNGAVLDSLNISPNFFLN